MSKYLLVYNGCNRTPTLFGQPILFSSAYSHTSGYNDIEFSAETVNEKIQTDGGFSRGWYRFEDYWVVSAVGKRFNTFYAKAQVGTWSSNSEAIMKKEEEFLKSLSATQYLLFSNVYVFARFLSVEIRRCVQSFEASPIYTKKNKK